MADHTFAHIYDAVIRIAAGHFTFPEGVPRRKNTRPFPQVFRDEFETSLAAFGRAYLACVTAGVSGTLQLEERPGRCWIFYAAGAGARRIRLEFFVNFSRKELQRRIRVSIICALRDNRKYLVIQAGRNIGGQWMFRTQGAFPTAHPLQTRFPVTAKESPPVTEGQVSQFIQAILAEILTPPT